MTCIASPRPPHPRGHRDPGPDPGEAIQSYGRAPDRSSRFLQRRTLVVSCRSPNVREPPDYTIAHSFRRADEGPNRPAFPSPSFLTVGGSAIDCLCGCPLRVRPTRNRPTKVDDGLPPSEPLVHRQKGCGNSNLRVQGIAPWATEADRTPLPRQTRRLIGP